QTINIGKSDGPRITFQVGHHQGTVGLLPPTTQSIPTIVPPGGRQPGGPSPGTSAGPVSRPQPTPPRQPPSPAQSSPRLYRPGDPQRTTATPIVRPAAGTQAVPQAGAQSGPPSQLDPPTRIGTSGDVADIPTRTMKTLGTGPEAPVAGAARIGR